MASEPMSDEEIAEARALLDADGVDPIEWAERAPRLIAEINRLRAENVHLVARREALLALVANISQTTPLASELEGWEGQRAALVAEVGTLRARVADVERDRDERLSAAHRGIQHAEAQVRDLLVRVVDAERDRDALSVRLEIAGPPEEPMPAFAISGERCECCGRVFIGGEQVASFAEGDVVACYGRCPEPEMWMVEYVDSCDGENKQESLGPWPRERAYVRAVGLRSRWWAADIRLVRARTHSTSAPDAE